VVVHEIYNDNMFQLTVNCATILTSDYVADLLSTGSKESQMAFPTTICSESGGGGSYVVYGAAAASHGSSTSDVEIQLPWGSSSVLQQQQQKASSPRSSSRTTATTTSPGSNMLEFSNNSSSSPREVGMQSCSLFSLSFSGGGCKADLSMCICIVPAFRRRCVNFQCTQE
jgi:hypothetical protein